MKKTILLLFGGQSSEHEVSITSARNIYAAIDPEKYEVKLCYITKAGQWLLTDEIAASVAGEELRPVLGRGSFELARSHETLPVDVILPVLHGPNGEDGTVQGLAQLLDIPMVGCDLASSAVCMDKDITKRLLRAAGIPVVDWLTHYAGQPVPAFQDVVDRLGLPFFVKPARQGSSVGVSKVANEQEYTQALEAAHRHDRKVLIERLAPGREVECAILGDTASPQASVVGEIKPEGEFYSYEAKYATTSTSQTFIPARLPDEVMQRVQQTALQAYEVLGCTGLARVDFFVADTGELWLNEVNTFPGFTNISMYPKLWEASGVSNTQLVDRLLHDALGR